MKWLDRWMLFGVALMAIGLMLDIRSCRHVDDGDDAIHITIHGCSCAR